MLQRNVRRYGVQKGRWPRKLVIFSGLCLMGCGSAETVSGERPLTFDEASELSTVQSNNYKISGAVVEVNSSFLSSGATLSMRATVDWQNHKGHAFVVATGPEAEVLEVYWNETTVFERIPAINGLLSARGEGMVEFIARPVDIERRQLDRAIAVVVGLAAKTPDNPVLIQQKEDSAFVRTDAHRGETVRVFRYGSRTVYWLSEDGAMLRFEGNSTALNAPIVVDVFERGKQVIDLPDPTNIISIEKVREIYDALVGV